MSDENIVPTFDMDDFLARYAAFEARAAELHPANKANLLSALRDAGITTVTVTFDGGGDSGQIEQIDVKAGDADAELPNVAVEIARLHFGNETIEHLSEPVCDAIEALCYDLLQTKHGGWENNEGAYGEFIFDVAAETIALDFNYRIETSENHTYEF